jgi:peptidyl-prolyl cis-trans isomerase D
MFDLVRKHTKILMVIMFLLIIPSFVLFGIDGYTRFRDKGEAVATVGSYDITQAEWDNAHKQQVDRIRAQMPTIEPKILDSADAKYATLERLVRDRVLGDAAEKLQLQTSDARLTRELQQNEMIASLRGPDGKLDMERYRQLTASQGLTPEGFEARVRRDISVRQVESGITSTGFATAAQAGVSLNAFFEKRELQFQSFLPADFAGKVNPTDAEIEAFYKDNQALFKATETANVEYVVLDLEAVKKTITLNEADVRTYFQQNQARLSGSEERRASHILLNAPKSAPAAEREKARAQAAELLAQARKSPDSFAELARKNSQDPGSAAQGGDLDFFTKGAMVKPFEDAAYSMNKGDISDVVESDFGFHIIRLTDIKEVKQKSFEELRAGLESELKDQQAKTKYAELAESFTNTVYEQSDSLKPVADKLKLEIKTASNLTRQTAPGATASAGILSNAKLLAAIFSTDSVEKKRNTEAVETAPNQMVSARVTQHNPARTMPLVDVKTAVREKLIAQRALELAKKEGNAKLAAWKAAPATAGLPAAVIVSRDKPLNVPPLLVEAALRADPATLPSFIGVDLGAQGFAVAKVTTAIARQAPSDDALKQELGQYSVGWSGAEAQAYYAGLKARFQVKILAPKPARLALDAAGTPMQ